MQRFYTLRNFQQFTHFLFDNYTSLHFRWHKVFCMFVRIPRFWETSPRMKQFIIAFLIFLVWSFFGLWLYSTLVDSKEEVSLASTETYKEEDSIPAKEESMDSVVVDSSELKTETKINRIPEDGFKAVTQTGDLVFLFDEGIGIRKNSANIEVPQASVDFKYKLNTYLVEHPDQELHILSYYDPSENLESPNLGEQRGMKMMQLLSKAGIMRERMVIKPTIKKMDFDTIGNFTNGMGFVFRPLDEERLKNPSITIPPAKSIYPKFVDNNIFPNQELKDVLAEMESILTAYPNVQVEVIGHTDNVGNAQDNYLLGLKYAQQVRWYLINKGKIKKSQIKARSKGEAEPIADNKYKKGRLLNRRIEIKYSIN